MALEIFKAAAMARDLKQRLELALGSDVSVSAGQDSQNWPTLFISQGAAATDDRLALVIRADGNGGRVDALGQSQPAYSPHRVDIIIGAADQLALEADEALRRRVVVEAAKSGAELEIREKANVDGDITDDSDLESGTWENYTVVQTIKSDEIHPLTKQM